MTFRQWTRWLRRSDNSLRWIAAALYVLVLAGAVTTAFNLNRFRTEVLDRAHQQVSGLAASLAQHIPLPLDPSAESSRLAPLHAGLGDDSVIAVFDRHGTLVLSQPVMSDKVGWPVGLGHFPWSDLGSFESAWSTDDVERVWGYAKLEDSSAVILVGLSRARVTAGVHQLAWHMAAVMVALAVGLLFLAHMIDQLRARRMAEAALRASNDAALQASRAKADFLANMSHELRTPMTGVMGMADLLMGTRLDDEQTRLLSTMRASAKTLLTVLNDVLDFSKVEAGQMQVECIDFDLREITKDTVRLLSPAAADKGLRLVTDIAPSCLRWVKGDPSRLQQILFNLIGNAIKFTDAGEVTVILRHDGTQTAFAVRDTGIGIAPDTLARLFNPFTQADVSTTRRYGGTGLGLAIAKRLVSLMGGEITAQSVPGHGSTFGFSLDLPEGRQPAAEIADPQIRAIHPLRVLLAEDNSVNKELVERMLERMGHGVVTANNGVEALELAAESDFDVILMDMQMPVMDGETATRLIRALPDRRARVPVIALTADAVLDHRDRYLAAGLDGFLTKPVSMKLLARTLDEAAGARSGSAEPPPLPPEPTIPMTDMPPMDATGPVVDESYLDDMRQWVGESTLLTLLADAPASLNTEMEIIRSAWNGGELSVVRETAHRLKGAAGSVGCRRLSDTAHAIQKMADAEITDPTVIDRLEREVRNACDRIIRWKPAQAAAS